MSKRSCMSDYFQSKKPRDQRYAPGPSFRPNRPYRTPTYRRWWPTGQRQYSFSRQYMRTKYGARMRTRQSDMPLRVVWRLPKVNLVPAASTNAVAHNTSENLNVITSHPQFAAFKALYREFKITEVINKFRVEKSSELLTDTNDPDITHWSKWDPTSRGRVLNELNMRASPNAKWRVLKPFQVVTSRIRPVYQDWNDTSDITRSGIRRVDNPWRDLDGTIPDDVSENGVIHLFQGAQRSGSAAAPFTIVLERTLIIQLRYRHDGSTYAA